jgi:hypothetical protein
VIINERIVDLEIKALEKDLEKRESGLSRESKSSLINKCIFIISNIQLLSPSCDTDKNSPQFRRVCLIYSKIQRFRR